MDVTGCKITGMKKSQNYQIIPLTAADLAHISFLKAPKDPKSLSICDAKSPVGCPPAPGAMLVQKMV